MHHLLKWAISAALLLALGPPVLAQYNPYAPVNAQTDPRVKRMLREKSVAYCGGGDAARVFVEKYGEDAVGAVAACSPAGARKLVEFNGSGGLGKLPDAVAMLRCISQPGCGDDVVMWIAQPGNAAKLSDPDTEAAFVQSALDYVLALRELEQGAAEARARRLAAQAAVTPAPVTSLPTVPPSQPQVSQIALDNRVLGVVGGGVIILLAIVAWKRRLSGAV